MIWSLIHQQTQTSAHKFYIVEFFSFFCENLFFCVLSKQKICKTVSLSCCCCRFRFHITRRRKNNKRGMKTKGAQKEKDMYLFIKPSSSTYPIMIEGRCIVFLSLSKASRALILVENVWWKFAAFGNATIIAQHIVI